MKKKQIETKSNKVNNPTSATARQIKVLLQAIEDMKDKIIEVSADKTISAAEKTAKLEEMGTALRETQNFTLSLVSDHYLQTSHPAN